MHFPATTVIRINIKYVYIYDVNLNQVSVHRFAKKLRTLNAMRWYGMKRGAMRWLRSRSVSMNTISDRDIIVNVIFIIYCMSARSICRNRRAKNVWIWVQKLAVQLKSDLSQKPKCESSIWVLMIFLFMERSIHLKRCTKTLTKSQAPWRIHGPQRNTALIVVN